MPTVVPIIFTSQSVAIRWPNARYQGREGRGEEVAGREVMERPSLCRCIA
ncbi:Uncharacterised protein [Mycobacterium tuberculosis]|nr:Uncharacterised protein [Mycobacterium tuberculosis]